jgi:hypothetical protein
MTIRVTLDDLIGFGKVVARFGPDRPFDRADPMWGVLEAELRWALAAADPATLMAELARLDLAKAWCRRCRSTRDLTRIS